MCLWIYRVVYWWTICNLLPTSSGWEAFCLWPLFQAKFQVKLPENEKKLNLFPNTVRRYFDSIWIFVCLSDCLYVTRYRPTICQSICLSRFQRWNNEREKFVNKKHARICTKYVTQNESIVFTISEFLLFVYYKRNRTIVENVAVWDFWRYMIHPCDDKQNTGTSAKLHDNWSGNANQAEVKFHLQVIWSDRS